MFLGLPSKNQISQAFFDNRKRLICETITKYHLLRRVQSH